MIKRLRELDNSVLHSIKKLHTKTLNKIMRAITRLGSGAMIWFALSSVLLVHRKTFNTAMNIMIGLLITLIMGEGIIKHVVRRVRPSEILPEEEHIVDPPKHYSFPSGHSASSFSVVAVTFIRCSPWLFVPVLVLASLIAFSRMYLRVHYITDVVAGVILGLVCGALSVPAYNAMAYGIGLLIGVPL